MPTFDTVVSSIFTGEVLRSSGLRGGSLALAAGGSTLVLHSVTFARRVSVIGKIVNFDKPKNVWGRIVIGGPAAARVVLGARRRRHRATRGRAGSVALKLNLLR
jgi:hypothetical protein